MPGTSDESFAGMKIKYVIQRPGVNPGAIVTME